MIHNLTLWADKNEIVIQDDSGLHKVKYQSREAAIVRYYDIFSGLPIETRIKLLIRDADLLATTIDHKNKDLTAP